MCNAMILRIILQDTMGWGENDRGVSFTFGAEVVAKFLHKHDFDLICRAHQVKIYLYIISLVMVSNCKDHCFHEFNQIVYFNMIFFF